MRYASHFAAGLLASLSACAQRSASTATTPATATPGRPRTVSTIPINTAPGDTALVFKRTPCYGTCPAYTATVFRNGQVSYFGERFVPVTGQHSLSLSQPIVMAMLEEARHLNFTQLAPSYRAGATDLPATVVTVYLPGQRRHEVFAERSAAPPALQGYIDYLAERLDPLAGLAR